MKQTAQPKQARAHWKARKNFNECLFSHIDALWWTDIRKTIVDIMINKATSDGELTCSLWELSNKAFTTRGNVSKIITVMEQKGILMVERIRHAGYSKNEENNYTFTPTLWKALQQRKPVLQDLEDIPPYLNAYIPSLTVTQRDVLKTVLKNCDKYGRVKFGVSNLAKQSGNSRGAVYNTLKVLESLKLVAVKKFSNAQTYQFRSFVWNKIASDTVQGKTRQQVDLSLQNRTMEIIPVNDFSNDKVFPSETVVHLEETDYIYTKHQKNINNSYITTRVSFPAKTVRNDKRIAKNRTSANAPVLRKINSNNTSVLEESDFVACSDRGFPSGKTLWSDITTNIRSNLLLAVSQFDDQLAEQFEQSETAQEVYVVLNKLRIEWADCIDEKTFHRLYTKPHEGRYLTVRTIIHFMNTLCKMHMVAKGSEGTILKSPLRFFAGTLDNPFRKSGIPDEQQLLLSLVKMVNENIKRFDKTFSERRAEKNVLAKEQAKEKVQLDKQAQDNKSMVAIAFIKTEEEFSVLSKRFNRILGRLRHSCGHYAYENWLKNIKISENKEILAPLGMRNWIVEQYYCRIAEFMQSELGKNGEILKNNSQY